MLHCNMSFLAECTSITVPYEAAKMMRRAPWTIYDAIVDLSSDSSMHKQCAVVDLTADNRCLLNVPEDCAQGYQTLCYQTSQFHTLDLRAGRAL
jgi:dTDP-4-dehydrorhamnose 3,5-epimerase-like enzyme